MASSLPGGVHLVGSLPASSVEAAFTESLQALPGRLRRVPDGELGERDKFVYYQMLRLPKEMQALPERPEIEISDAEEAVHNLEIKTGYDDAAIQSYEVFKRLKHEGRVPQDVRFQVSLPSPVNLVSHARPAYRKALDPKYTAALAQDVDHIVKSIPANELAIQIDCALDMAYLEGDASEPGYGTILAPYFEPVLGGLLDRIEAMTQIPPEAELGFHLCYGDLFSKHFKQPNMAKMVDYANAISGRINRRIDWFHMPVPKESDAAYFAPLKGFGAQLYLGLIHPNDLGGTRRRIDAAKTVVSEFGISTECGLGRLAPESMASIFDIARAVSRPY